MKKSIAIFTILFIFLVFTTLQTVVFSATTDDIVFIHHSCGENWLNSGLSSALSKKSYIDEVNDITYGTSFGPDRGRPASLWDTPGDNTDMVHWIFWFNDYLETVKAYGTANGENRVIMFKSCYPNNNVTAIGGRGDPFSYDQTVNNYKALFTYPHGVNAYRYEGYSYKPLELIFAENPDTLFIFVTAPPLCHGDGNSADGKRARQFYDWVEGEWLPDYNRKNPGLKNVAVFNWFDFLANDEKNSRNPNLLQSIYGGDDWDSHPNDRANRESTIRFVSGKDNLLDDVWERFMQ